MAEGKALCLAMKLARAHDHPNVVLETNCKSLVSRLSKGAIYFSVLDSILEDILSSCSSFIMLNGITCDGMTILLLIT